MRRRAILLRLVLALLGAATASVLCWTLAQAAVGTARGQRLDQLVLTAGRNDSSTLSKVVFPVLDTVTVPVIVAALVIAVILALAQRRAATVVHIVVLVGGAALTTQVLKHLVVDRASLAGGLDVTPNSFPSGHATIAAAVAVALTLAAPHPLRSAVAILCAAWTAIAGIGTIAGGWHRPSDVLGALLVVAAWSSLVLAIDAAIALATATAPPPASAAWGKARARRPTPVVPVHRPPLFGLWLLSALGIIGVVGGAIVLAQIPTPLELGDRSAQAYAYAGSAAALAGSACCLLAWVLLLHVPVAHRRRTGPSPRPAERDAAEDRTRGGRAGDGHLPDGRPTDDRPIGERPLPVRDAPATAEPLEPRDAARADRDPRHEHADPGRVR